MAIASVLLLPLVAAPRAGTGTVTPMRSYEFVIGECPRGVMVTSIFIARIRDEAFALVPTFATRDGSMERGDWYIYNFTQTTDPGWVRCGSNWETAHTYLVNDIAGRAGSRHLSVWGPHGRDPINGAEVEWSIRSRFLYVHESYYFASWMRVIDLSDKSMNEGRGRFHIEHDLEETNDPIEAPSTQRYSSYPSAAINTNDCDWSLVDARYSVLWRHHEWWGWGDYFDWNQSPYYVDALDPCIRL